MTKCENYIKFLVNDRKFLVQISKICYNYGQMEMLHR